MNMRQRFGLVLLLFWTSFSGSATTAIQQVAAVLVLTVGVILFTFPRKDEPQ